MKYSGKYFMFEVNKNYSFVEITEERFDNEKINPCLFISDRTYGNDKYANMPKDFYLHKDYQGDYFVSIPSKDGIVLTHRTTCYVNIVETVKNLLITRIWKKTYWYYTNGIKIENEKRERQELINLVANLTKEVTELKVKLKEAEEIIASYSGQDEEDY